MSFASVKMPRYVSRYGRNLFQGISQTKWFMELKLTCKKSTSAWILIYSCEHGWILDLSIDRNRFISDGRLDTIQVDSIPRADPSVELDVRSFVACALKCRQRRAFSFALLAPQTDSTQRRCFIYDDDVTVRPMMTSEGSVYVTLVMSISLIESREPWTNYILENTFYRGISIFKIKLNLQYMYLYIRKSLLCTVVPTHSSHSIYLCAQDACTFSYNSSSHHIPVQLTATTEFMFNTSHPTFFFSTKEH